MTGIEVFIGVLAALLVRDAVKEWLRSHKYRTWGRPDIWTRLADKLGITVGFTSR